MYFLFLFFTLPVFLPLFLFPSFLSVLLYFSLLSVFPHKFCFLSVFPPFFWPFFLLSIFPPFLFLFLSVIFISSLFSFFIPLSVSYSMSLSQCFSDDMSLFFCSFFSVFVDSDGFFGLSISFYLSFAVPIDFLSFCFGKKNLYFSWKAGMSCNVTV